MFGVRGKFSPEGENFGRDGDRTHDPQTASLMLSQLSYPPTVKTAKYFEIKNYFNK